MYAYRDPKRESNPHALPDVEIFYRTAQENENDGWLDNDGTPYRKGWYYSVGVGVAERFLWACFPGCMSDSEPVGPFDSREEALAAAQDTD